MNLVKKNLTSTKCMVLIKQFMLALMKQTGIYQGWNEFPLLPKETQ